MIMRELMLLTLIVVRSRSCVCQISQIIEVPHGTPNSLMISQRCPIIIESCVHEEQQCYNLLKLSWDYLFLNYLLLLIFTIRNVVSFLRRLSLNRPNPLPAFDPSPIEIAPSSTLLCFCFNVSINSVGAINSTIVV